MAMGIVDHNDFEKELASLIKVAEPKVLDINRGRGNVNEVPETLRNVIIEEAITGTPPDEIREAFGISKSSISAYKHGATSTSTYHKPNKKLDTQVDKVKKSIASSARNTIRKALSHITEDKFEEAELREISGVARDMAAVMEKMEGNAKEDRAVNQVVIYAPRMKEEDSYDVIDISGLSQFDHTQ